jgi:hypothetical protein
MGKHRISVVVDDDAKNAIVAYQGKIGVTTRDEAVELAFKSLKPSELRIKELEARVKELGGEP